MRYSLVAALLFSVGCHKAPDQAPAEIGELGLFLVEHFEDKEIQTEDESDLDLNKAILDLVDYIKSEDLTGKAKDRAVTMPILTEDRMGKLKQPAGISTDEQVPIAITGESIHPISKQVELFVEPNQVCIASDTTVYGQREFLSDTGCFTDGSCKDLKTVDEIFRKSPLAKVWMDQYKNYRHFSVVDADGGEREVYLALSWIDKQFWADPENKSGNSWNQSVHVDVFIEDGNKTLRWFAMWSSVTIGGVSDDFYSSLVVDGIEQSLLFSDEFLSGSQDSCKLDRDEQFDRP